MVATRAGGLVDQPPRFSELIGKNPAIVEKHRGFNPPLGILSLAGYLEERSGFSVSVFDAQPRTLLRAIGGRAAK
jgi:hypothetical protein